jgi:hypothetical protein
MPSSSPFHQAFMVLSHRWETFTAIQSMNTTPSDSLPPSEYATLHDRSSPQTTSFEHPIRFEGSTLHPAKESPYTGMIVADFPGQVRHFRSAGRHLIYRLATRGTRRLKPSEAAFRDEGYEITRIAVSQENWRGYYASRGKEELHIRERMSEPASGRTWHSLGSWFWHATLLPNSGPWEMISVITPLAMR